jgi:hypothetical protein
MQNNNLSPTTWKEQVIFIKKHAKALRLRHVTNKNSQQSFTVRRRFPLII